MNKYAAKMLETGIHISLCPIHYETSVSDIFILKTTLAKINLPVNDNSDIKAMKTKYAKSIANSLVKYLNKGSITLDFMKSEVAKLNLDLKNHTITV